MKEYELFLDLDKKINANKKASKLVKLGCFDQKDVTDFNPALYNDLTLDDKLFKRLYRLYEDSEGNMIYAQPLIEADDNGEVHGQASAYDVIYVETMSDEIFNTICNVNSKTHGNLIYKILFWILLLAVVTLFVLVVANVIASSVAAGSLYSGVQTSFLYLLFFNLNLGVFAIYTYLMFKHK